MELGNILRTAASPQMAIPTIIAGITLAIFALLTIILIGTGNWIPGVVFLFLAAANGFVLYYMMYGMWKF
jgi:flagellar biosynthesis protein FliQ